MYSKDFDNNKITKKLALGGVGVGGGLTALAAILTKKKISLPSALKASLGGALIGGGSGLVGGNAADYVRGGVDLGKRHPVKRILDTLKTSAVKDAHETGALASKGTGALGAGLALSAYKKTFDNLSLIAPNLTKSLGSKARIAAVLGAMGYAGGAALGYGAGAVGGGANNLLTKLKFQPKKKD